MKLILVKKINFLKTTNIYEAQNKQKIDFKTHVVKHFLKERIDVCMK